MKVAANSRFARERLMDLPQRAEELADVVRQELGLLERGEVSTARHLRPALNFEEALRPLARRLRQVLGEHGEAGRSGGCR